MAETVQSALRAATERLAAAGLPSPRVDAELLLGKLLGVPRGRLMLLNDLAAADLSAESVLARYDRLLARRAQGVPLQHLTGFAPFRHLVLQVGEGVFVPRPETELIVELAGPVLQDADVVVDLCAGSGAIALAVANETSAKQVVAVERSAAALGWLGRNAATRAEAGDRPIEIMAGDVSDPALLTELDGQVDVVLSNPPYVPFRLADRLPAEVAYDPGEAVFGGADGMELMPALFATAARLLRPGGTVVVEHDESQVAALDCLLRDEGCWQEITQQRDLAGRPRFVRAVRQDGPRD